MKKFLKYALYIFGGILLAGILFAQPKENKQAKMTPEEIESIAPPKNISSRPFLMGFTQWPPSFELEDIEKAYAFNATYGDIAVYHQTAGIPWQDALENKKLTRLEDRDWKFIREHMPKKSPRYIALTPLDSDRTGLAKNVTEQDDNAPLPKEWSALDLDDAKVKQAYLNYTLKAIDYFEPTYLAIAIEPNVMLGKKPERFDAFTELYGYTYREVKKRHPNITIFFTAQYENLMGYTSESRGKEKLQHKSISSLLQYSDILGVSTYPYMGDKRDVPENYYDSLATYGKPIAVGESGYVSKPFKILGFTVPGSEERQLHFLETLLQSAEKGEYLFVVNWVSHDFDKLIEKMPPIVADFGRIWMTTGFVESDGREKGALKLWKSYFTLTQKR